MIITEHFAINKNEVNYVYYSNEKRYEPKYVKKRFLFFFKMEFDDGCFVDRHIVKINFKNGKTTRTAFTSVDECNDKLREIVLMLGSCD